MSLALGKEARFAECRTEHSTKNLTWGLSLAGYLSSVLVGTRQRLNLCRVLLGRHSAKLTPLPSVVLDTRQTSLPSAQEKVLGKEHYTTVDL
jgi:hypothetical protein